MKRLSILMGLVLAVAATVAGIQSYRRHAHEVQQSTIPSGWVWTACFDAAGRHMIASGKHDLTAFSCQQYPFEKAWVLPNADTSQLWAIEPEGDHIALGFLRGSDGSSSNVTILDASTGRVMREFRAHDGGVCQIKYLDGEKYMLTSGMPDGVDWGTAGEVRLWRTDTWEKTAEILELPSPIIGIDADPESRFIVMEHTIDRACKVGVFDPRTLELLRYWDAPGEVMYDLTVSNDGSLVACTHHSGLYVYQVADGKLVRHELTDRGCGRVEWLPDSSSRLAVSSEDGAFLVDLAREETQRVYGKARALSVDPQGRYLAIGHREGVRLLRLSDLLDR